MHGAMDYATVMGAVAAPRLMKMPPKAASLAYGVASGIFGLAAFTNFKPAIKRAVPLRVHEMADATLGMALPALPFVLGFGKNKTARNFFFGLTALLALNTLLTDWNQTQA
jgi:hypothetical protein